MTTAIVWFRRDLRITDNPALSAALQKYQQIIPVYIHAPQEASPWSAGSASNWWLHHSLTALHNSLRQLGSYLLLRQGSSIVTLQELIETHHVDAIYWNRVYDPQLIERDKAIKAHLLSKNIDCCSFNSHLITEPHSVSNKAGKPFKVFSAYWRTVSAQLSQLSPPLDKPSRIVSPQQSGESFLPASLQLLSTIPWYKAWDSYWQPGEEGAQHRLNSFITDRMANYTTNRDIPSVDGTSKLSPHLHFGEVSPRQILFSCFEAYNQELYLLPQQERLFAELGWREFAYYLLFHFPNSIQQSLDTRFDQLDWQMSSQQQEWLESWQQGRTGIPLVDAGMRELWQTGWMHNRVRMITASLLTKNMGIYWLHGAKWFWDTLVDADLAANTLGWQWTAGCGVDAAPYFRVFSPARQAERFDPNGLYIKRWVAELADADKETLYYGCKSANRSHAYPLPIIDIATSRKIALQQWDIIKQLPKSDPDSL